MDGTPYTFFKQGDHVVAGMMSIAGDVIAHRQDQWI